MWLPEKSQEIVQHDSVRLCDSVFASEKLCVLGATRDINLAVVDVGRRAESYPAVAAVSRRRPCRRCRTAPVSYGPNMCFRPAIYFSAYLYCPCSITQCVSPFSSFAFLLLLSLLLDSISRFTRTWTSFVSLFAARYAFCFISPATLIYIFFRADQSRKNTCVCLYINCWDLWNLHQS